MKRLKPIPPQLIDWNDYEQRVSALEAEGMTRSDAQGIVDLEIMQETNAKQVADKFLADNTIEIEP